MLVVDERHSSFALYHSVKKGDAFLYDIMQDGKQHLVIRLDDCLADLTTDTRYELNAVPDTASVERVAIRISVRELGGCQ